MSAPADSELLKKIEAYMASTNMKPWAFGRKAVNDPRLVQQLRDGRELRTPTRKKVLAFIASDKRSAS